ncbi:MAG: iron ABC transporter permease [Spirochaetales bacterium]|nr:iron ABC transporter permease [Spirochaetales bacterium]
MTKLDRTQKWQSNISRFKTYIRQPHIILSLVLLVLLVVLVIIPILKMFIDSFIWQLEDVRLSRDARPGHFTFFHWKRIFASGISKTVLWTPLLNSITIGLSISFLAMSIGGFLAWVIARTDIPFRKLITAVAVVPYMIPSYIHALSWLTLFKNDRIGGSAGLFQYLTGIAPPDWVSYGYLPIVITLSIHYFPYTFLLVSASLKSIDSRLEESGEILGATRGHILRTITFPLVIPALLSSFILTFSRTIGIFGTPHFLGAPVRFFTLTTQIYSNINNRNTATGYILAFILLALSSIIIFINQRMVGKRKSFVTIGGKGFRINRTPLGKKKSIILVLVFLLIFIAVVLPIFLLTLQTFSKYSGSYSLKDLTTLFWVGAGGTEFAEGEAGVLRNPIILKSAWNSIKLAVISSLMAGFIGIFVGYAVVKGRNTKLSQILEQVAFLPYLVPSIAFGALYLALFTKKIGPLPALYGTFALLVLVSVAKNLPFTSRTGVSAMLQIGSELEEASEISGARWVRSFRKIIFPLSIRSAVSGFILVFITVMRELAVIVLLVSPKTRTLTTMTFRYQEQGYLQFSNAISMMIIVIVLVGNFAARKIAKVEED